jgi:hypothetical protein
MYLLRASSCGAALLALGGLSVITACGSARGAPMAQQASTSAPHGGQRSPTASDTGRRPSDSLDRALDRLDAAHAALDAADAQAAAAMRALDAALDEVARLGGDVGPETWRVERNGFDEDANTMARRAEEEAERISATAGQTAMRSAMIAMTQARRHVAEMSMRHAHVMCRCARARDGDDDATDDHMDDDGDSDERP